MSEPVRRGILDDDQFSILMETALGNDKEQARLAKVNYFMNTRHAEAGRLGSVMRWKGRTPIRLDPKFAQERMLDLKITLNDQKITALRMDEKLKSLLKDNKEQINSIYDMLGSQDGIRKAVYAADPYQAESLQKLFHAEPDIMNYFMQTPAFVNVEQPVFEQFLRQILPQYAKYGTKDSKMYDHFMRLRGDARINAQLAANLEANKNVHALVRTGGHIAAVTGAMIPGGAMPGLGINAAAQAGAQHVNPYQGQTDQN